MLQNTSFAPNLNKLSPEAALRHCFAVLRGSSSHQCAYTIVLEVKYLHLGWLGFSGSPLVFEIPALISIMQTVVADHSFVLFCFSVKSVMHKSMLRGGEVTFDKIFNQILGESRCTGYKAFAVPMPVKNIVEVRLESI